MTKIILSSLIALFAATSAFAADAPEAASAPAAAAPAHAKVAHKKKAVKHAAKKAAPAKKADDGFDGRTYPLDLRMTLGGKRVRLGMVNSAAEARKAVAKYKRQHA
jgi:hypothetical protein